MESIKRRNKNKPYPCAECGKIIRSDNMKRHLNSHKKACIFCKLLFTIILLNAHIPVCPQNPLNYKAGNSTTLIPESSTELVPIIKEEEIINHPEVNDPGFMFYKKKKLRELREIKSKEDRSLALSSVEHYFLSEIEPKLETNLDNLYPWEEQIIKLLEEINWDERSIYVLFDPVGGIGKTTFIKHMSKFENVLTVFGSKQTCLQEAYYKKLNDLERLYWQVLINLERSVKETPFFIEKMKDGILPRYIYHKKDLSICKCTIFIFCNSLACVKDISMDRLKIYIVNDNILIPKTFNEIQLHKKFSCNNCFYSTDRKHNLFMHQRNCKKLSTLKLPSRNDTPDTNCFFHCSICSFETLYKSELRTHYNECSKKEIAKFNSEQYKTLYNDVKINNIFNKNETVINNNTYVGFCHVCNQSSDKLICEKCNHTTIEISSNNEKIKCIYCEYKILPCKMQNHIKLNHKDNIVNQSNYMLCVHCFEYYNNLDDHKLKCKPVKRCLTCFENYINLDDHNKKCIPNNEPIQLYNQCMKCNAMYINENHICKMII